MAGNERQPEKAAFLEGMDVAMQAIRTGQAFIDDPRREKQLQELHDVYRLGLPFHANAASKVATWAKTVRAAWGRCDILSVLRLLESIKDVQRRQRYRYLEQLVKNE